MSNSPSLWNWDFQPADPSNFDSPRNSNRDITPPQLDSPWFHDDDQGLSWLDEHYDYDRSLRLAPIDPENTFVGILPPLAPQGLLDASASASAPVRPLSSSASSSDPFQSEPSPPPPEHEQPPPSNQHSRRELTPSQHQRFLDRLHNGEISGEIPEPDIDIFAEYDNYNFIPEPFEMAPSRHTRSSSYVDLTASSPPQPRPAPNPSRKRKAETPGEGRPRKSGKTILKSDDIETVDLVDVDDLEQYEELKAQKQADAIKAQNQAEATKPIKLAQFKCIICMDDPADLTVTHCGHLFCSECLHQALHAGERKCCPVCRNAIVVPRTGQKPTAKGYFPLSMKLTTAKKHGKRPVRA